MTAETRRVLLLAVDHEDARAWHAANSRDGKFYTATVRGRDAARGCEVDEIVTTQRFDEHPMRDEVLAAARPCVMAAEWREAESRKAQLAELSQWPHELQHVANLEAEYTADDVREAVDPDDANVYTSRIVDAAGEITGKHTIVLDLDVPAQLVPSSTPGHSHLYVDVPMGWPAYRRVLTALAEAGVVEDGYAAASIERGHTAVRVPWIKKGTPA